MATAACVAAPVLVAFGLPTALRLPAVLALLCLAPGTAILAALRGRIELGLALATSLAATAVLAQSMLWLGAWWPKAFLYGLAVACFPPLLARLLRARQGQPAAQSPPAPAGSRRPPRLDLRAVVAVARGRRERARYAFRGITWSIAGHSALLALSLSLWAASLAGAELGRIDGIGLLSALPPAYFLAFGLLLIGFTVALTRSELSPRLLGTYVIALVFVIHGTIPLLYDQPRPEAVYKHLAVINFIGEGGGIDRQIDIYNNWPAFFALNAWFSGLAGIEPAAYANWAPVFFNLANLAALQFALRGVTSDERLLWTATGLFLLANWVGQDYLAPQAFAFVLSLVIVGLCLRCGLPSREPRLRAARGLAALLDRLRRAVVRRSPTEEPLAAALLTPRAAAVIGGLCYLAVVVSHQLTPFFLIASLTGLALVVRRLPLWMPLTMAAVELGWLALAWPYVSTHFSLFNVDPLSSTAPMGYEGGNGLPGLQLVASAAGAEYVLLGGLAAIGLVRRGRAGHWDLAAATLMICPWLVVLAQSYGGEGRFRVFLFALPWLSLLAAAACAPSSRRHLLPRFMRQWRLALASGATGVCLLFAYFGLEYANRFNSADVDAAVWFEQHAPPQSLLLQVGANSVSRVTARYPTAHDTTYAVAPALTEQAQFQGRSLGSKDLPAIEMTLRGYGSAHSFLILTQAQQRVARLYGTAPPDWRRSLEGALHRSPSFRVAYLEGSSTIFEYRP